MIVSDRNVDLSAFFPFSCCGPDVEAKALSTGKCVKYSTGEPILTSGSPAKHCGVILDGQAVIFKTDENGKRYQICLEEGCFIGLETIETGSRYTGKVVAASDIEIFFWNADGILKLMDEYPEFCSAMDLLNNGRIYQEQWLIPETDTTDPVLCSRAPHWLYIIAPAFIMIPLVFMILWAFSMLIRRYPATWLLIFGLFIGAGSYLFRILAARANERLIVTSKNLILIPQKNEEPMTVARLYDLQEITVRQNLFEQLIDAGNLVIQTSDRELLTRLFRYPIQIAGLIHNYAGRAALGRPIPLRLKGRGKQISLHPRKPDASKSTGRDAEGHVSGFRAIEFRAHWALLVKMIIKPLLVMLAALYCIPLFRTSYYADAIHKILLIITGIAAAVIIYKIISWRNHRFIIEEDRIRDYSYQPLSREDQNMAMNHKIQSVRFRKEGFFQVLLNYGTVYILAGEGELSFDYVSDPAHVQELIMNTCAKYESNRILEESERRKAYISELVTEIHRESSDF
ncbi:MAG: cyclic nucleotide-binding domain-containing protein [Anaerolineaceae bacterium]|nr:cyclic nucleotide-binding domain-containing protein [Anaerolineaceae bacterium]